MPDGGASNGSNGRRAALLDRLLEAADDACALKDRAAGVAAICAVFDAIEGDEPSVDET